MTNIQIVPHADTDEVQVRVVSDSGDIISVTPWYPSAHEAHMAVIRIGRAANVWLANKAALYPNGSGEMVLDIMKEAQ